MKKKILAMLMALVMVASIFPASIFATENDDEHDHIHCPGEDKAHTLENCAHAELITKVEGDCVAWGYTIYQCPECEEKFADEFVEPTGAHEWELIEEGAPADCENDGKEDYYECTICGSTKGGNVIEAGHDWEAVVLQPGEDNPNECIVQRTCKTCGKIELDKGKHDWSEHPTKIEKEPTYLEDGIAIYTCEACGFEKEVVILCEHECTDADLEVQEGTPATCTETGIEDHLQCKKCKKIYSLNKELLTAEKLVIPAKDHNWKKADSEDSTCTKTGYINYKCAVADCNAHKTENIEMKDHNYYEDPILHVDPTCTEWGYTLYACKDCGHVEELKKVEPKGHSKFEDGTDKDEVKPTCTKGGYQAWNCKDCQTPCYKEFKALDHDLATVTVAAHCHRYGYTYTYCKRDCCDDNLGYTDEYVEGKSGIAYPVAVDEKPVHLKEIKIDVDGGFDPDNHTRDNSRSEVINPATCLEDGDELFFCLYCDFNDVIVLPATEHAEESIYVDKTNAAPTCTTPGIIETICKDCDTVLKTEVIEPDPHKADGYESVEAAVEQHELPVGADWVTHRKGTCLVHGLYISTEACVHCGKYLLVVDQNTGKGHTVPEKDEDWEKAPSAPTCTEPGFTGTYICKNAYCKQLIEGEDIKALDHEEGPAATCTTAQVCTRKGCDHTFKDATSHAYYIEDNGVATCTTYQYLHNVCVNCGDEYIDAYLPAWGHNMVEIIPAGCESIGYEKCSNRGCIFDRDIPATGHEDKDGNPIVDSCLDANEDRECVLCEQTIEKSHKNVTIVEGEKTCISYAYRVHLCNDCGESWIVEYPEEGYADHDWSYSYDLTIVPTFHEGGTVVGVCDYCGEIGEKDIDALNGLGVILEVDNAVVSGAELVDSGKLVVTVKLDGNNVDVWGVRIPVLYDTDVLVFDKAEFESEIFLNNTAYNIVDEDDYIGIVMCVANVHNNDNKEAQNTNINEAHTLVKLYFDINTYGSEYDSAVVVPVMEALDAAGEAVDTSEYFKFRMYGHYGVAFFSVAQYMDANDDGFVNLADALYVYNIIASGADTYDARVDINKDGVINLFDFTALYKYLSYEYSYEDMVNGGVKVDEEA